MKLQTLLQRLSNARVRGDGNIDVTGIVSDSRAVRRGNIFVAMPGATAKSSHGMAFADKALAAGAAVILSDREAPGAVCVIVVDVPLALSVLAEAVHGDPSAKLRLLAVTGTNGKTTTAHLIEAMAVARGETAGFIGTTAVRLAGVDRPTAHTTPPADVISAILAEMIAAGVKTCAMEVSSHALEQKRAEALRFAGAVFTNLTQDHLDYHLTLDAYFAAKRRLFTELLPQDAAPVLNVDDGRVAQLAAELGERAITFSATGQAAKVRAANVRRSVHGTEIDVESPWGAFTVKTPLVGTYNVANILGAAAVHLATGTPVQAVVDGAGALDRVPGRLDRVVHPRGAHVLVDYAHTDDALARALDAVRPYVKEGGRLFVVFGCGGDRDAGKRTRMGEAAARRADFVVVTSDNPRSERPEAIADAIVEGIERTGLARADEQVSGRGFHVELDRAKAIGLAVRAAQRGDVVLIAGKGHEREQIFADRKIPFDDRQVAADAMKEIGGAA